MGTGGGTASAKKEIDMNTGLTRRASVIVAIFTTSLFALLSASVAHAVSFTANLNGAAEVPPNASANSGITKIKINPATGLLSWTTTSTIPVGSMTGHHIHQANAGANGSVVVGFASYSGTQTISTTVAASIIANPANFYVNLHTTPFPGGEIRGQITADPVVCSMDIDDDGLVQASTDGLLITRAMLGLTGTALTNGALGANAFRTAWVDIRSFLNTNCGTSFSP